MVHVKMPNVFSLRSTEGRKKRRDEGRLLLVILSGPQTLLRGQESRIIDSSSIGKEEGLRLSPLKGLLDWSRTPPVLGRCMAGTGCGWLEIL